MAFLDEKGLERLCFNINDSLNGKVSQVVVDNTGETDISSKLQDIIDSIDSATTLYFPAGIYRIENTITVNKNNINILGSHAKIVVSESVEHECFLWDNTETYENIQISGFHFVGAIEKQGQCFIKFQGAKNVSIFNCIFESCGGTALVNTYGDIIDDIVIRDCKFIRTNNSGIVMRPITNAKIYNNYFEEINGYSSSAPAHGIYLRADGDGINALENIYIYSNVFHSCNKADYSGKYFIKVLSNKTNSADYIGKNIYIANNRADEWTSGIHVSRVSGVSIIGNSLNLSTENINGSAVLIENSDDVVLSNNDIYMDYVTKLSSGSKAYSMGLNISYVSKMRINNNTLRGKSYYAISIAGDRDTETDTTQTVTSDYDISGNFIEHIADQSDAYTIRFSADMQSVDVTRNKIACSVRGVVLGSNSFNDMHVCGNIFTHLSDELDSAGLAVSKGSATLENYTQAGNIIFGFATTGATEYDICSKT